MRNRTSPEPDPKTRAAVTRPLACILSLVALFGCTRTAPETPAPSAAAAAAPAATETLVLVGTTDVHGYVMPHDYYTNRSIDNGLALLKPKVDSLRAAHTGAVYLFDSGDLIQGNPLGFVYSPGGPEGRLPNGQPSPNPIIRAMNLMEYDAGAIGNHEFNYGLDHIRRAVAQAEYPFVSANIFDARTGAHAFKPYVLLPHVSDIGDTITIGVTGNTPPGVHVWDKQHVEGHLLFKSVVTSLTPVVAEMREKGADVVVVLSHGGLEGTSYDTIATGLPPENESARAAREVPGIDVIFLGHTHRELADTTINGVLLTQPKNWATNLALAKVTMRREAPNRWTVAAKHGEIVDPDPKRIDRDFADSLRIPHERTIAYVNSIIGRSTARMEARVARVQDTPILDFINEVQRRVTGADLSATAAFSVNSAIPEGPVTVADIAGLYIYDNTLKAVRITGAELKAYLEQSARYFTGWPPQGSSIINREIPGYNFDVITGVDYVIDVSRPSGDRIRSLRFRGRPVRMDQTFTLAVNNYRQNGGGGFSMIARAPVVYDRQENIRELLIDEVRRRGTIRPGDYFKQNWTLVPKAAADSARKEQARELRAAATAAAAAKRLRVLATNDFHGRLLPEKPSWARGREVGGSAALAAYFARERAGFGGPTVILDGGDVMQGTPISNLTQGRSVVEYFNQVQYTAAALGNHEFDWGVDVLKERVKQAKFAWLGANIFVAGSDTAPAWVQQTALVEVHGVKLGIIGLATEETPAVTLPSRIRGLTFGDESDAIDRWVPVLRGRGADFVVVVAHSGATCERETQKCTGDIIDAAREVTHRPDLIVGGHTHQVVRTRVNGIPIVETGSYGTRYGIVDLERVSADSVAAYFRDMPNAFVDEIRPDSATAALVERFRLEIGPKVERVIAHVAEPLERTGREYALGRLIADAQRAALKADVGFMNNGGIRAALDAGPATWSELFSIQPFENLMVRLRMTGEQLRAFAEHSINDSGPDSHISGMTVRYDPSKSRGQRVGEIRLSDGSLLRPDAEYSVAVNNFIADQAEREGQAFLSREDTDRIDLDVLVDYMAALPQPVRAPAEPRWIASGGGTH